MRKAKSLKRIVPSAECAILHTHNAYQGMKGFHPHEVVELLYGIKEKFLHNPIAFKFLGCKDTHIIYIPLYLKFGMYYHLCVLQPCVILNWL